MRRIINPIPNRCSGHFLLSLFARDHDLDHDPAPNHKHDLDQDQALVPDLDLNKDFAHNFDLDPDLDLDLGG